MKGIYVAAVLLTALSTLCKSSDDSPPHGAIDFSGAVVGTSCALTTHPTGVMAQSCTLNSVPHSLTVHTLTNGLTGKILARPLTRSSAEYILVDAAGRKVTQGRYVVTQTVF